MSPFVLRRKLQKKAKRRRYRRCPLCDGRTKCYVTTWSNFDPKQDIDNGWVLVNRCQNKECKFKAEIKWSGSGDGIGRRIPDGK